MGLELSGWRRIGCPGSAVRVIGAVVLLAVCCRAPPAAAAQEQSESRVGQARFVGRNWAEIRPNLNFRYACDTGWHSFSFRSDGYFIYNRTIAGAWWLDHSGNVQVLTNQGERLLLFYDSSRVLTQRQASADGPASVFGTDFKQYQECET